MADVRLNRKIKKALWRLGMREPFRLPAQRKDARFRYYAFAHAHRYGKRRGSEVWSLLRSNAKSPTTNQTGNEHVNDDQKDCDSV